MMPLQDRTNRPLVASGGGIDASQPVKLGLGATVPALQRSINRPPPAVSAVPAPLPSPIHLADLPQAAPLPVSVPATTGVSLRECEKVALLGLALQQSNRNLESAHDVIRALRGQVDALQSGVQQQIARITKKAEAAASAAATATSMADDSSVFSPDTTLGSPARRALDDSSLPSPIRSLPSSPRHSSFDSTETTAAWQLERQTLLSQTESLAEENARLRHELETMRLREREAQSTHSAAQDALVSSLQSQLDQALLEVKQKEQEAFSASQVRRKLADEVQPLRGNIRVVTRVRPLLEKEASSSSIVHTELHTNLVSLGSVASGRGIQHFEFDGTLGPKATQANLFEEADALVTSVLDGFNVCLLAYGISGSGKTHSMEGTSSDPGLNARSLARLFGTMEEQAEEYTFEVKLTMVEIYQETIRDLLLASKDTPGHLMRAEDAPCTGVCDVQTSGSSSVQLRGAVVLFVRSLVEIGSALSRGHSLRASAATQTNERSSRSHCIVSLTVTSTHRITGTRLHGKMHLVDLAGSEDVSVSKVEHQQLRESQGINKSLSALSLVFQALSNKAPHVPYRNSKLTHLLSDSLGGNSKALLVLCLSPSASVHSETLNCLKFGSTVRTVRQAVQQNRESAGGVRGAAGGQHVRRNSATAAPTGSSSSIAVLRR